MDGRNPNDEWFTPPEILGALGSFDLDPACGPLCKTQTAAKRFEVDGLDQPWEGRVWLNPPFSNARPWIDRFIQHGNGVALVFARSDAKWFQDAVKAAGGVFLLHGRVGFIRPCGKTSRCPLGCALIPLGDRNVVAVKESGLAGIFLRINP